MSRLPPTWPCQIRADVRFGADRQVAGAPVDERMAALVCRALVATRGVLV